MALDPIDQRLAELRWEAAPHSSGVFSLASQAALEKLGQFQLRDPQRYCLAAVAAGCSAGANEVAVTVRPDSCKIELLGWHDVPMSSLRDLFTALFSSDPALVSLRYLARAVLAAAGLKPLYVSLRLTQPGAHNAGSLLLTGQHFSQTKSWGRGRPGLCLTVQERPHSGVFQRLFGSLLGAQSPTLELLRANCSFSTVPIRVNGKLIHCPPRLGECKKVWKIGDVKGDWRGTPSVRQLPGRENFRALVGWSPNQAWGCPSTVVVHGVHYPLPDTVFGARYARGVIWCDDARPDLSLENIVEDEAWKAHQKWLKEQAV